MAARNAAQWIEEAIRSCLSQELPIDWELELLVGIDGCPTTLAKLHDCGLIEHPKVSIHLMDKNYGTYVTANTLATLAEGVVISRMDADDVMLPGRLAEMLHILDSKAEIGMVNTWHEYRTADLQTCVAIEQKAADGVWMFRRDTFDRLGGFQPWFCGADTDIIQRAAFAKVRSLTIQKALYVVRIHPDQLTKQKKTGTGSLIRSSVQQHLDASVNWYRKGASTKVFRVTGSSTAVKPTKLSSSINLSPLYHPLAIQTTVAENQKASLEHLFQEFKKILPDEGSFLTIWGCETEIYDYQTKDTVIWQGLEEIEPAIFHTVLATLKKKTKQIIIMAPWGLGVKGFTITPPIFHLQGFNTCSIFTQGQKEGAGCYLLAWWNND